MLLSFAAIISCLNRLARRRCSPSAMAKSSLDRVLFVGAGKAEKPAQQRHPEIAELFPKVCFRELNGSSSGYRLEFCGLLQPFDLSIDTLLLRLEQVKFRSEGSLSGSRCCCFDHFQIS